jgi:hypothetical protein
VRFSTPTRAEIHQAPPGQAVAILWPAEQEPAVGGLYWIQKAEEQPRHPEETLAEAIYAMKRRLGTAPSRPPKKRRRRSLRSRPQAGDPRIIVREIKQRLSWSEGDGATLTRCLVAVELYENPDPVIYLQTKAFVPAGPNPLTGDQEKAETEPEQIPESEIERHHRRMEEEEAMRIAHKASVDQSELVRQERHLISKQRRTKRPSPLLSAAMQRQRMRENEKDDRSDCKDAA